MLDFAEARMYQNLHGRFTAIDPLLASGKSANPQTFNRYVYTMNQPLILTDPKGLQAGFIAKHPKTAEEIGYPEPEKIKTNVSYVAARYAVNSAFTNQREGGEQNALRHVIWAALITVKYGADIGKQATDSHETTGSLEIPADRTYTDQQVADTAVDLENNAIGIELGVRAAEQNLTPGQIAGEALNIFEQSGLWVTRIHDDGSATIVKTTIGQNEADATRKNWANRNQQTGFTPEAQAQYEKNLRENKEAAERELHQRRSERVQ